MTHATRLIRYAAGLALTAAAGLASAQTASASCDAGTDLSGNRSYKVNLPTHDGQTVSFNVLEPASFDCQNVAAGAHPLMLHGPGFGGSGSTSGFGGYRGAGYTVISWDPRGFGGTSGTVRVMDPEFEGQYLLQILDWAEENLDYLSWRDEATGAYTARPASKSSTAGGVNLVVGAQGGSYGGGYQLLILATDSKKRLDAIAPDITWHDLRNSLNPGDAIKSLWDLALTGLGEANGHASLDTPDNDGMDPFIKETLARGAATNEFPRRALDWFHYRGLGYWCAANNLPAMQYPNYAPDVVPMVDALGTYNVPDRNTDGSPGIGDFLVGAQNPASYFNGLDVLLTQGMIDTLFNFNEAWWNQQCLSAAGADVSLYTHNGGHAVNGAQAGQFPANSGSCAYNEQAWFDARLRPETAAVELAETCFALGTSGDTVNLAAADVLAPGANDRFTVRSVPEMTVVPNGPIGIANTTGNAAVSASLGTMTAGGILAGMPKVDLTVASVAGANELAQDCSDPTVPTRNGCDSIIFVGVGKSSNGFNFSLIDDQVTPLRGLGRHSVDLVGIAERVAEGEELALLFYASHPQFFTSVSRDLTIPAVLVSGTASLPLFATDGDGNPAPEATESVLSGTAPPPPDSDGDGIADDVDNCPADANSDQTDTDGDGTGDACDAQNDTDTDGDGVRDEIDSCPNTPAGAAVDANGCADSQKDSDGDGVSDDLDQCPATPAGTAVGSDGCEQPASALTVSLSADPTSGDITDGPLTVTFTADAVNNDPQGGAISYVYYYGDGTNSGIVSLSSISHDYDKAGNYQASVVVVDENNNSARDTVAITTTTTITVNEDPIVVEAVLNVQLSGNTAPVTAMFDASGSTAPEGAIYRFDFGNGDVQEGSNQLATRTYALAGSYTVTLTVTDANDANNTDTTTAIVTVGSGQQTTVQLVVTPTTANIGQTVTFDASASIAAEGTQIVSYQFDFDDGTVVTRTVSEFGDQAGIATHAYSAAATYSPTVTVTDSSQAQQRASLKVKVNPAQPPVTDSPAQSGGGALGVMLLLPLLAFGIRRRRCKFAA